MVRCKNKSVQKTMNLMKNSRISPPFSSSSKSISNSRIIDHHIRHNVQLSPAIGTPINSLVILVLRQQSQSL